MELPAPVIDVGLKLTEFWLPCPEADSVIAELKPPVTAVETVTCPEALRFTLTVVGDALTEKPAVVPVTVSDTVVVCTVAPDVPETVILYVPGVVEAATVKLSVDVPVPVIDVGLKPTVTPEGAPEADKATAELNPPVTVLVMVALPDPPCAIETDDGDAERL